MLHKAPLIVTASKRDMLCEPVQGDDITDIVFDTVVLPDEGCATISTACRYFAVHSVSHGNYGVPLSTGAQPTRKYCLIQRLL